MERKTMSIDELWDYVDDVYKYATQDYLGATRLSHIQMLMDNGRFIGNCTHIEIPFIITGIHSQNLKRPVKIEAGMFGMFWDIKNVRYNYLKCINNNKYRYTDILNTDWINFEPIDPATLPKMIEVK